MNNVYFFALRYKMNIPSFFGKQSEKSPHSYDEDAIRTAIKETVMSPRHKNAFSYSHSSPPPTVHSVNSPTTASPFNFSPASMPENTSPTMSPHTISPDASPYQEDFSAAHSPQTKGLPQEIHNMQQQVDKQTKLLGMIQQMTPRKQSCQRTNNPELVEFLGQILSGLFQPVNTSSSTELFMVLVVFVVAILVLLILPLIALTRV